MENFNGQVLTRLLSGKLIGSSVHFFHEVASTNDVAFSLALKGISEGAVIIADAQKRGKGRLNRTWQSPAGSNLYISIIIRPSTESACASQISLMAGVAVAELLCPYCPSVALKWPNDVQVGGKKMSGILTEMRASGKEVEFVVVGIGINVNMKREVFDGDIRKVSTSLREETGADISRVALTVKLCDNFERWYKKYIREGFGPVRDAWLGYSIKEMYTKVVSGDKVQKGQVIGIDETGALLLIDENKITRQIIAGDVSIIKD
ncbi:MAG: biotin--[acetyl-CoA-carboxylase] ligase [Syntrophales bacterium]